MEEASRIVLGGPTIDTETAVIAHYPQRYAKSNTAKNGKKSEEELFWDKVINLL